MRILFCIHDFKESNLKLQPWLTIYQIGKALVNMGHEVFVITDIQTSGEIPEIKIFAVNSLRGSNSKEIRKVIKIISPDIAIISVSPLSLVTSMWFDAIREIKSYAFLSYPFYNFIEFFRAVPHLNHSDRYIFCRHLFIPGVAWRYVLSKFFNGALSQSIRTGQRVNIKKNKSFKIHSISPGIDKKQWFPLEHGEKRTQETIFLYAGSPKRIRGFNLILDAFGKLSTKKIKLKILARGADTNKTEMISALIRDRGLEAQVEVAGGWISGDQLRKHMAEFDAVLLPFVLVPSELPVTVMESIACGTPVIVSDIDGLPEAVGDCGLIVRQADAGHLAETLYKFHTDGHLKAQLQEKCLKKYKTMVSWDVTAKKWLKVFESDLNETAE